MMFVGSQELLIGSTQERLLEESQRGHCYLLVGELGVYSQDSARMELKANSMFFEPFVYFLDGSLAGNCG